VVPVFFFPSFFLNPSPSSLFLSLSSPPKSHRRSFVAFIRSTKPTSISTSTHLSSESPKSKKKKKKVAAAAASRRRPPRPLPTPDQSPTPTTSKKNIAIYRVVPHHQQHPPFWNINEPARELLFWKRPRCRLSLSRISADKEPIVQRTRTLPLRHRPDKRGQLSPRSTVCDVHCSALFFPIDGDMRCARGRGR
jgi:hypothetical protein